MNPMLKEKLKTLNDALAQITSNIELVSIEFNETDNVPNRTNTLKKANQITDLIDACEYAIEVLTKSM